MEYWTGKIDGRHVRIPLMHGEEHPALAVQLFDELMHGMHGFFVRHCLREGARRSGQSNIDSVCPTCDTGTAW